MSKIEVPFVTWVTCGCYVWPVAPYAGIGACGLCRDLADVVVQAPKSGRAMSLKEYNAQRDA